MILIIDNYDSFTYNLYQCIAQYTSDVEIVRNDKITVDEIRKKQPTAIILSPGPGRPEDAGICIQVIKTLGKNIPILGVCLGHQAITMAFGGKVIQAPEIVHGKADAISHNQQGIYQHLPQPFNAGRYHSLIADKNSFPEVLEIEAESADGLIMGLKHKTFPIYGVQFHPESILTPQGSQLLKTFCLQVA
ncbi:MAG: anthranilate synthase component II [Gammaproteobacteria bacterium]